MLRISVAIRGQMLRTQPEDNANGTWRGRVARRRGQMGLVRGSLQTLGKKVPPLPAKVTLTRVAWTKKPLDGDNLVSSLKHVRDEVAMWLKHQGAFGNWWEEVKPGEGDGADDPVEWVYAQEKTHRGHHVVRIEVESLSGGEP